MASASKAHIVFNETYSVTRGHVYHTFTESLYTCLDCRAILGFYTAIKVELQKIVFESFSNTSSEIRPHDDDGIAGQENYDKFFCLREKSSKASRKRYIFGFSEDGK